MEQHIDFNNTPANLDRHTAAAYLGLSVEKLDHLARHGEIVRVKIGSGPRARVLYTRADLDDFINSHRQAVR